MNRRDLIVILEPVVTLAVFIIAWYRIPPPSWDFTTRSVVGSLVVLAAAISGYVLGINLKSSYSKILKFCFIILIVCFIILPTYIFSNPTKPAEPVIRITYPANFGVVHATEYINGTSQNLPPNSSIWLIKYIPGLYYPLGNATPQHSPNGDWLRRVDFGGIDVGQDNRSFEIHVVLVNETIQKIFDGYMNNSLKTHSWDGIPAHTVPDFNLDKVSYCAITVTQVKS